MSKSIQQRAEEAVTEWYRVGGVPLAEVIVKHFADLEPNDVAKHCHGCNHPDATPCEGVK